MTRIPRIDDPYDAAKTAYPEPEGSAGGALTLRVGAYIPLVATLIKAVSDAMGHFSDKARNERLQALFEALNDKIEYEMQLRKSAVLPDVDTQARVESTEFTSALRESCLQAHLSSDKARVDRFAAVLGGAIFSEEWLGTAPDLTSFIKILVDLSDQDIRVLELLRSVFKDEIKHNPNLHDPNPFTERMGDLRQAIHNAGFHADDFYAYCRRLEGFGLASEVLRNTSRMGLGDNCFRPTRLGLRFAALLDDKNHPRA